jgi:hypothetical protein
MQSKNSEIKNLKLSKHFDNSLGSRFCAGRVLPGNKATVDNMEIIPDTG